jgi:hypothetical protein
LAWLAEQRRKSSFDNSTFSASFGKPTQGNHLVTNLLKMQLLKDDDDDEDDSASAQRSDGRPAWMHSLLESARNWMGLLPDSLVALRQTVEEFKTDT